MSNGDAPDLRVAEAEEEGSIWLVEEKAGDILLTNEADDQPGQSAGKTWLWARGVEGEPTLGV